MPDAIQTHIRQLLERFGYPVNVSQDRRLGKILKSKDARKLRQWCGDYLGSGGKPQGGHVPSSAQQVRKIFTALLDAAPSDQRPELRKEVERVCGLIESRKASPPTVTIPMGDIKAIVAALRALMSKQSCAVRLDVVTRPVDDHSTVTDCMGPMLRELKNLAQTLGLIKVRIIERRSQISMRPETCPGVRIDVHSEGPLNLLSWHGSLVSTETDDERRPVGGMFGYQSNYHVLELPSAALSTERELTEKLNDFDRAWKIISGTGSRPRTFGVAA